jgi:protein O-mannosyl-transferase
LTHNEGGALAPPFFLADFMTNRAIHFLAILLIAIAGVAAYTGSLRNGFVWDDHYQIVRNPFLHSDQPWRPIFTTDVWAYTRGGQPGTSNYYRPLQMLSYRILAGTSGLNPSVFHGASLILNILAACAAYWLLFLLTQEAWIALCAALLFAVHPVHSETVFWIAALGELGCALFFFLAFGFYVLGFRHAEPVGPAKGRRRKQQENVAHRGVWMVASCICLLISLLWKEMALTLPVVAVWYGVLYPPAAEMPLRKRAMAALTRSAPLWGITVLYLIVRFAVLGRFSAVQHDWPLTPLLYGLTAAKMVATYWAKLVFPAGLNAFHVFHPARSFSDVYALAGFALLIVAAILIVRGARKFPLASFAGGCVFITLIPVLNLRGVGENVFTERYLYIPSLGFCLLGTYLARECLRWIPPKTSVAVAAGMVAVLVVLSVVEVRARAGDWRDDFTLLSATVRSSPDSAVMRNGLGHVLAEQRHDLDAAQTQYDLALDLARNESPPNREQIANALVGLGGVYYWRHDFARSLQYLDEAIATDSTFGSARIARGMDLLALGRLDEAQAALAEAHHVYPNDEVVTNGLGMVALARHDTQAAIERFSEAVHLVPDYADGFLNLGRALLEANRVDDAVPALRRACELAPDNAFSHAFYGNALARAGRYPDARGELERALSIDPAFKWAQDNLDAVNRVSPPA